MPSDNDITLNIATPAGPYTDTFPKTAKIAEVISTAIAAMGLQGGEQFELVYNGQTLQPTERPLVSFGLTDGAQLELVATGAGV